MAASPAKSPDRSGSLLSRLLRVRVGWMLLRNTVVSTGVFLVGLGVLWLLVEHGGMDAAIASGIGFIVANSLHYVLGRAWIFRGTDRAVASGYALFLVNGAMGLALTVGLMALLLRTTAVDYLVLRVIVSAVAGLAMFVFNATVNFRRV